MSTLTFNNSVDSKHRSKTKSLSLEKQNEVISILNNVLEPGFKTKISQKNKTLLQNFINDYQNMKHYVSYTSGLFATDVPNKVIDSENVLYQLKL